MTQCAESAIPEPTRERQAGHLAPDGGPLYNCPAVREPIDCPLCRSRFLPPNQPAAGKRVRCTTCGESFDIPPPRGRGTLRGTLPPDSFEYFETLEPAAARGLLADGASGDGLAHQLFGDLDLEDPGLPADVSPTGPGLLEEAMREFSVQASQEQVSRISNYSSGLKPLVNASLPRSSAKPGPERVRKLPSTLLARLLMTAILVGLILASGLIFIKGGRVWNGAPGTFHVFCDTLAQAFQWLAFVLSRCNSLFNLLYYSGRGLRSRLYCFFVPYWNK